MSANEAGIKKQEVESLARVHAFLKGTRIPPKNFNH